MEQLLHGPIVLFSSYTIVISFSTPCRKPGLFLHLWPQPSSLCVLASQQTSNSLQRRISRLLLWYASRRRSPIRRSFLRFSLHWNQLLAYSENARHRGLRKSASSIIRILKEQMAARAAIGKVQCTGHVTRRAFRQETENRRKVEYGE